MRYAIVPGGLFEPLGWAFTQLVALLEAVAFWTAATFPLVHVVAVVLYVRESLPGTALLLLVGLNAVAIVAGHRYNRDPTGERR